MNVVRHCDESMFCSKPNSAFIRLVFAKSAHLKRAYVKSAPSIFASMKQVFSSVARLKLDGPFADGPSFAFLNDEPVRSTPMKTAPRRSAFSKFVKRHDPAGSALKLRSTK